MTKVTHHQDTPADTAFELAPQKDKIPSKPGPSLAGLASWIDIDIFDGLVALLVGGIRNVGDGVSRTQSGKIQRYFIGIIISLALIILIARQIS